MSEIVFSNMQNSTWTEKANNNNIVITGNINSFVVDKKSTITSLAINQLNSKDSSTKIKVDGKVKEAVVETITEIILTGQNANDFITKVSNRTKEIVVINFVTKEIRINPEVKAIPTPTEDPKDTVIPTPIEDPKDTITSTPTVEPTSPIDSTVPENPIVPAEPTVPTEPIVPTYPTAPAEPTEPTEPTAPTEPVHSHTYAVIVNKEATCTENGVKTYTCTICNDNYIEVIPGIGHNSNDWITVKEATITENGVKELRCNVCNIILDRSLIMKDLMVNLDIKCMILLQLILFEILL